MKYKHNKRINTGLLYEMLVRALAESFIDKDEQMSEKILSIITKYYSSGNVLAEENNIYAVVLSNKADNKKIANSIIREIIAYSRKLNIKEIDSTKSKLLKEIDCTLASNFFDRRIKNYKTYASIHQLIQISRNTNSTLDAGLKKIKLQESICNFLLSNKPSEVKALEASKKYNNLVFNLVIEKYNKKYNKKLTKNQKVLIKNLVESNDSDFKKYILDTMNAVSKRIKKYKYKTVISENKVLKVKFEQISEKWQDDSDIIKKQLITESSLTMLLKYIGLLDKVKE